MPEMHVLSESDVAKYNKEGHSLDSSKTYAIKFLFNDKLNEATDPEPFELDTTLLDKLEKNAIGMPWIVPPYGKDMHIRGTDHGLPDTAEALLEVQAKYSIGKIADTVRTDSNNVYGIIEIFPEFVGSVKNDHIPPLVSPTLNVIKKDGPKVTDAEFLNLQSVPSSGYPPILTKIKGVCQGGIRKCMDELAPLAAAKTLEASRKDTGKFSNILSRVVGSAMSEQQQEVSNEKIMEGIDKLGTQLKTVVEAVVMIAEGAEGVDADEIKQKLGAESSEPEGNGEGEGDQPPAGASKAAIQTKGKPAPKKNETVTDAIQEHPEFKKLQSQLSKMEKQNQQREEEIKMEKRKIQAEKLVEFKMKLHKVKPEEKDKAVENYVNLKNEEGNLVDLSPIVSELSEAVGTVEGAFGRYGKPEIPEMTTGTPSHSNLEVMEELS